MSSSTEARRDGRPRGRVLRGSDVTRVLDLRDLAQDAPVASNKVDLVDLNRLRQEAYEAGFAQGARDGALAAHDEMERRLADEVAQRRAQAASALGRLEDAVARALAADRLRLQELADELLQAAIELATDVVAHDVRWSPSAGRDALARALAVLGDDLDGVVVRLHPSDAEALSAGDLVAVAPGRRLEVVADPTVSPGSCLAEAGAARVDARLETALARARAVLEDVA
jgi:flagellar assembly protein FliH